MVVMCTEDATFPTSEDCTYLETMGVGMLQTALQLVDYMVQIIDQYQKYSQEYWVVLRM